MGSIMSQSAQHGFRWQFPEGLLFHELRSIGSCQQASPGIADITLDPHNLPGKKQVFTLSILQSWVKQQRRIHKGVTVHLPQALHPYLGGMTRIGADGSLA